MAQGDITFFEEALLDRLVDGWAASDDIKVAICDNTTAPTAAFGTPSLDDFTEIGTSGSYTAGGISIGTLTSILSEAAGVMKCDSTTNPSWVFHASNDTDAHWAIIYNDTQSGNPAFAFVDLDGPVDMVAGGLNIDWHASGIYTDTIT